MAGIYKIIPLLGICSGLQMIKAFLGDKASIFENCVLERRVKDNHIEKG